MLAVRRSHPAAGDSFDRLNLSDIDEWHRRNSNSIKETEDAGHQCRLEIQRSFARASCLTAATEYNGPVQSEICSIIRFCVRPASVEGSSVFSALPNRSFGEYNSWSDGHSMRCGNFRLDRAGSKRYYSPARGRPTVKATETAIRPESLVSKPAACWSPIGHPLVSNQRRRNLTSPTPEQFPDRLCRNLRCRNRRTNRPTLDDCRPWIPDLSAISQSWPISTTGRARWPTNCCSRVAPSQSASFVTRCSTIWRLSATAASQ